MQQKYSSFFCLINILASILNVACQCVRNRNKLSDESNFCALKKELTTSIKTSFNYLPVVFLQTESEIQKLTILFYSTRFTIYIKYAAAELAIDELIQ